MSDTKPRPEGEKHWLVRPKTIRNLWVGASFCWSP